MESDKNNQSNVEIQNQLHTTSNDGNIQPYNSSTLSHSQISLLQLQIRQFKQLTKQYSESKFSKWILENELGNNPNNNNANGNKLLSTTNSTTNSNSNIPSTTFNNPTTTSGAFSSIQNFGGINTQQTIPTPFINHNNNPGLTNISTQHYASGNPVPSLLPSMTPQIMQPQTLKPMSTLPPTITNISNVIREPVPPAMMLWRPLSAAVNCGPKMFSEGAIGTSQLDQGCLDYSSQSPILLTRPYATTLRELALARLTTKIPSASVEKLSTANQSQLKALETQRKQMIENFPIKSTNNSSDITTTAIANGTTIPTQWRSFVRTKAVRRDLRNYEREERRKRGELEDRRRKRVADFHKTLFLHRDEFLRFHKAKRGECGKVARALRLADEQREARKEKDLARADSRRMQALRENDMEAYSQLLQETKNDRLHYILRQADAYIASINEMIIKHSLNVAAGDDPEDEQATEGVTDPSLSKASSAAKDMYRNVHRRQEIVTQPRSLTGGELKEYQLSGVQWLVSLYNNKLNGILADEMGLGKTIQTIALLTHLMEKKNNRGPFMIVVPLSTLSNWVNEFSKWAPHMIKIIYKGTPIMRRQMFRDEIEGGAFNVLLTTYEYIMKDKGYLRRLTWQYIIVDEGHRMKNKESKFAQTLGTLYQARHRILLTGTPLQNNVHELWALLNFLLPEIFHSSESFETWFNKPFASFKKQGPPGIQDEQGEVAGLTEEETILLINKLHEVIRPFMLRRVKQEVLDQLPEKIEKIVRCGLSGFQKRIYSAIASRTIKDKDVDDDDVGGTSHSGLNNALMQLRKVCNHPYLFLSEWYADEDLVRASGKFELLNRMLPKLLRAGHRVLMFSQHTQVMTILERFFDMHAFRHLRLDGSTPADEREKRMYMFNDPDSPYFIFLLSTRAGGLGLNLATADTVILFDSDWNPMMDAQAQDRAHRIGQKNEVRVFRLVSASPVEERILAQASYKKNRATITIEMSGANAMGKHIENPDKDIVMKSLLHEMNSNTGVSSNVVLPSMNGSGGGGGEDGDDEEEDEEEASDLLSEELLNEMMATSEGELELYRRMDLEQLPSKRPPLMTGEETPAWLMPHHWAKNAQLLDCMRQDSAEAAGTAGPKKLGRKKGGLVDEDDGFFSGGKVMRKRKDLQYDDGLTEKQFMRMMERHANSGGDLNAVGSNTDLPSGKIRFEPVVDDNMPVLRQLQTTDYAFLRKLLNDEITGAVSADGVRDASALFLQKPDKKLYPDYYALIPEPISLKEICAELKRKAYITLADLEFDLCLMALNARTYNTEASFVFLDVQHLRRTFYQRCIEQGLLVGIELSVDSLDEHGALMELPPLPQSYAQLLQEASTGDFISKSSLQALSLVGSSAALKKSTSKTATKASIRPKKSVSETSLSNFADNQSESFSQPIIESTAEPKSSTKSKRKFTFVHTEEDPHSSTEVGQSKTQPSMPQSASKSRKSVSVSDGGASRPTEEPLPRLVLNLSKKNK